MKPVFHPQLVNQPWEDSALYIDCLFQKRGILFDLGELYNLPARKVLRITDIFVSHAHIDHFAGFDHVLRICLGRPRSLRIYGPAGMIDRVAGKLAGYTWNLVENYATDFTIQVTEVVSEQMVRQANFHCRQKFALQEKGCHAIRPNTLLDEALFAVHFAILNHRIPCLAFALQEKSHVNIMKNRLQEMLLPTGPWLHDFKVALLAQQPDDTPFTVWWKESGERQEKILPLGELRQRLVQITRGQKIAYVTDTRYDEETAPRIKALITGADVLFIETPFLEEDREQAANKYHLTAAQAGALARASGVGHIVPFHYSPRYADDYGRLSREANATFTSGNKGLT